MGADNPFTRQDRADNGVGVFRNGHLVAAADTDAEAWARFEQLRADGASNGLEVLKRCSEHPDTSVVDCVICWPVED